MTEPLFSVNEYDKDGDKTEHGIYLHFDETRIRVAKNLKEFEKLIESLKGMADEIRETYGDLQ